MILDTVSKYVLLKPAGSGGLYIGLCPFHDEKTGSFTVDPRRGTFRCFGCRLSGTEENFIDEMTRKEVPSDMNGHRQNMEQNSWWEYTRRKNAWKASNRGATTIEYRKACRRIADELGL